jgi:hypothetical protein
MLSELDVGALTRRAKRAPSSPEGRGIGAAIWNLDLTWRSQTSVGLSRTGRGAWSAGMLSELDVGALTRRAKRAPSSPEGRGIPVE